MAPPLLRHALGRTWRRASDTISATAERREPGQTASAAPIREVAAQIESWQDRAGRGAAVVHRPDETGVFAFTTIGKAREARKPEGVMVTNPVVNFVA
jgi:hypothetical protein